MIAVMMSTFILFFAFVINTGMLVNAQINLQNAADMAAYAGASVQARQLTQISYLNYEMRRQWKKFLFRVYVLGNMSKDSFPRTSPGPGAVKTPMQYTQTAPGGGVTINYQVPTTCMIFNSGDNYCRLQTLPKIGIPPSAPLDGINETLRGQLQQIEAIRESNCVGIGATNKILNYYWLYNADPTMANAMRAFGNVPGLDANITRILIGLVQGIGIVPRELILRFRIKTLTGYVNEAPQSGLNYGQVQSLLASMDPPAYERSIQAFLSAFYTLGNHSFPSSTIQMDELQNSTQLVLNDIRPANGFDTWAIDMQLGADSSGIADINNPADCHAVLVPLSIKRPLTLGVSKAPSTLTYYAVRLKAKAKVLFSPFGDMQLKAYSAARPFGSRIGPQDTPFGHIGKPPNDTGLVSVGFIPNLPVRSIDSSAQGNGWDTQEILGAMYNSLTSVSTIPGTLSSAITADMIQKAYSQAMAPNPWEASQYNIINDLGTDSFIQNFGTNEIASFWAPIFPPGQQATSSQEIQSAVKNLFVDPSQSGLGVNVFQPLQDAVTQTLQTYISTTLSQPQAGENLESQWIATIGNPFKTLPTGSSPSKFLGGDPSLFIQGNSPSEYKTSWNQPNRSDLRREGRVGYSVKFVSFDSITKQKTRSDGRTAFSNDISSDGEASIDIPFIKH